MQQNKNKQVGQKGLFLLGEEPDGAQFALVDQTDGPGVEIVQRPLAQYDLISDKPSEKPDWNLRPGQIVDSRSSTPYN